MVEIGLLVVLSVVMFAIGYESRPHKVQERIIYREGGSARVEVRLVGEGCEGAKCIGTMTLTPDAKMRGWAYWVADRTCSPTGFTIHDIKTGERLNTSRSFPLNKPTIEPGERLTIDISGRLMDCGVPS